jgi:hypothetical protein
MSTHAFTHKYDEIVRFITTPVRVGFIIDPNQRTNCIDFSKLETREYVALWDTGANRTFISDKVIQECKFIPSGKVCHVSGSRAQRVETELFSISLRLPNDVVFSPLQVARAEGFTKGDVLVGMDIISLVDFAITNQNSKTIFTFCCPPVHNLDFYAETVPAIDHST